MNDADRYRLQQAEQTLRAAGFEPDSRGNWHPAEPDPEADDSRTGRTLLQPKPSPFVHRICRDGDAAPLKVDLVIQDEDDAISLREDSVGQVQWHSRYYVAGAWLSGWVLYFLDDPVSPSPCVDTHFIGGMSDDPAQALGDADRFLRTRYRSLI